jgi:hypothetical protein
MCEGRSLGGDGGGRSPPPRIWKSLRVVTRKAWNARVWTRTLGDTLHDIVPTWSWLSQLEAVVSTQRRECSDCPNCILMKNNGKKFCVASPLWITFSPSYSWGCTLKFSVGVDQTYWIEWNDNAWLGKIYGIFGSIIDHTFWDHFASDF